MVPRTFEAYTLEGKVLRRTDFLVSHVTKTKLRADDEFISMSEAAGVFDKDKDLSMAGARYSFSEHADIGAIGQYAWDLFHTFYAEANLAGEVTDELAFRLGAQYTDQRSVGDELLGDFDTYVFGGKVAASYYGVTLSFAFSSTANDNPILSPFGGYPGYLSLMISDFNRAGEDAWLVGLSSNLSRVNLPVLRDFSFFINYASGDTPESGSKASPDQQELDLTVDYRVQNGPLKGLWLRARRAMLDGDGADGRDINDTRVILNYEVPIL